MAMSDGKEILEPYELNYSDVISLSSIDNVRQLSASSSSTTSEGEMDRLEAVNRAIMEALGPYGPGLLAITGFPKVSNLRHTLLLLARDLALLNNDLRKRILKDHGLGSDVPLKNLDRIVSSFAMQLKYGSDLNSSNLSCGNPDSLNRPCEMEDHFKDLGGSFRELGFCMMDLGLRVARICDRTIGGNELEQSLLESATAKGRLIHYHSALDTHIIKESARRKVSKKGQHNSKDDSFYFRDQQKSKNGGKMQKDDLWQEWHYDYGSFTVLTSPMFMRPKHNQTVTSENSLMKVCGSEIPSPSGHTYLQILHPHKNNICIVKAPPESFILQVGEAADILSKGKLQSTLHSVLRPVEIEYVSRETFVVFLHPAWSKVFHTSDYPLDQCGKNRGIAQDDKNEVNKLTQEIHKIIPPLSTRLKVGMTFADFSRETTRQYYGGNGLQSNR